MNKLEIAFQLNEQNFRYDFVNDIFLEHNLDEYDESDNNLYAWLSFRLKDFDTKNCLISIYISDDRIKGYEIAEKYQTQLYAKTAYNIYYSEYTGGCFHSGEIKINNHNIKDILKQYSGKYCILQIEEIEQLGIK